VTDGADKERRSELATNPSMDDGEEDELLVMRVALDGCEKSLKKLIDRHSGKLTGWLTRRFQRLKEPEIAATVNWTFMNIWRKAGQFNSLRGKFESWMFRIAFRVAESMRLREERHLAVALSTDPDYDPEKECDEEIDEDDEPIADRKDWRVRELRRFIDSLTGNERAVADADLEFGSRVDNVLLAEQRGTTRRAIIQTRSNYRKKFRDRVEKIEKNRTSGKGRI
jgi:DNA-directed RNA polymerase specialized sigma24 family protein